MRTLRAFDADTHVNPAAEVLDRYVDSTSGRGSRSWRLPVATGQMMGGTPDTHQYRVATKLYRASWRGGRSRIVHGPAHAVDGHQAATASAAGRPGRQPHRDMDEEGPTRTSWCRRCGSASSAFPTFARRSD